MTGTMANNGRARKTLADQIDRLDAILDGLADALNTAVAEAVRQGVEVAVKAALAGTLALPDLLQRLPGPAVQAGPRPSALKRLLAAARRTAGRVVSGIGRCGRWLGRAIRNLPATTRRLAAAAWRRTVSGMRWLLVAARGWPALAWRLRGPVLMALSVGGAVAWGCYVAGPLIASAVGGLAEAAETLSARARRLQVKR